MKASRPALMVFSAWLAFSPMALAGGTAQLQMGSGSDKVITTVDFDGELLRITPQIEGNPYTIFRDGKPYAINQEGGQPVVFDLGSMAALAGKFMQQAAVGGQTFGEVSSYQSLTNTGRSETVAGVRGEVHLLTYTDEQGQRHSDEMVLTNNATLGEMNLAMAAFSLSMVEAMGQKQAEGAKAISAELQRRNFGLLRYGNDYRVISLSKSTPPASRFVLPAAPTALPSLPAGMAEMMGGGTGSTPSKGGFFGRVFGQQAERQQERVEQRAESEVDAATDRAVDSVLDRALGKLFGQ